MTEKKRKRNPIVVLLVSIGVTIGIGVAGAKGLELGPFKPAIEEAVNQGIDGAVDAVTKK